MTMTKEAVISAAMHLTEQEKLEVIWQLSQSVNSTDGVAAIWDAEIDRRLESIAEGTARFLPWVQVRSRLLGEANAASR